jgi:hypothetical protein
MLVGFNTNAAGIGSLTVPISTKATSAVGAEPAEALPPTNTPNRALLSTFTTLPGKGVQTPPPFTDTKPVNASVDGSRSNRNQTFVVALLAKLPITAALPSFSHHHSTTWAPTLSRHNIT